MTTILSVAIGVLVFVWVLWNFVFLAVRGKEEVRFFEVSTGRWGE
jgi:hypothetical protein